jgi:hypothetical protein
MIVAASLGVFILGGAWKDLMLLLSGELECLLALYIISIDLSLSIEWDSDLLVNLKLYSRSFISWIDT